jgi:hypothetical protein
MNDRLEQLDGDLFQPISEEEPATLPGESGCGTEWCWVDDVLKRDYILD